MLLHGYKLLSENLNRKYSLHYSATYVSLYNTIFMLLHEIMETVLR
jgi:hypothetical protein